MRLALLLPLAAVLVAAPTAARAAAAPAPPAPPAPAPPASAFEVLPPPSPAATLVTPFLREQLDLAWRQDDARRAVFEGVHTEADLLALQAELRKKLLDVIGGLPSERTPLNARVTGTVPGPGYRIEKVIFESLPGVHVTALLYVPDGAAGPRPAVLLACGHAADGKAYRNYQEIAGQLALRGYVVLCWDPVGQGERSQFWDAAQKKSRYNLECGEHAVLGGLACLAGTTLNRYMVWDGMRALDYLLTRPEVDGHRISATGTSGGGFQTLYLAALDERIQAAAPSCFVTSLPMRMANRIFEDPDSDPEQDPFRLVSAGIDHAGLLLLLYPRPVILAAAVKDFFPIEGTRKTFREVRALYARFGKASRIAMAEGYHGHMYSPENRRAAFAFLDRANGLPVHDGLETIPILPAEQLRCTPTGQVRVDLPGRGLAEVIRAELRAHAQKPAASFADLYRASGARETAALAVTPFTGSADPAAIGWAPAGTATVGATRVDRYVLHHGAFLEIPVLHFHRPGRAAHEVVLDLGFAGKVGPAEWSEVTALLDAGRDVVSFDGRGLGETAMRFRTLHPTEPPPTGPLDPTEAASPISSVLANHAYNGLLTGRPYLVDLVEDAGVVARFATERLGATRLLVRPRGEAAAWADAVVRVVPGTALLPGPGPAFRFSETVERLRELWPIEYLVPGGARLDAPPAAAAAR